MVITDACGTTNDGFALFPYEGGVYTDVDGAILDANGEFVPIAGSTLFYADVPEGYVFPDGSVRQEFDLTFTDTPCD